MEVITLFLQGCRGGGGMPPVRQLAKSNKRFPLWDLLPLAGAASSEPKLLAKGERRADFGPIFSGLLEQWKWLVRNGSI